MPVKNSFLHHKKTRNQRRRKSRRSTRASKRSRRHRHTMRGGACQACTSPMRGGACQACASPMRGGGYLGFGIQPYATVIRRPIEDDQYAAPITTLYSEVEEKDIVP